MKFLNRCNGVYSNRLRLSEEALKVFSANIGTARSAWRKIAEEYRQDRQQYFTYEGRDYYFGSRFLDDKRVRERIESGLSGGFDVPALTEADFLATPLAWCMDALRDCAGADHWYTFEKDWG